MRECAGVFLRSCVSAGSFSNTTTPHRIACDARCWWTSSGTSLPEGSEFECTSRFALAQLLVLLLLPLLLLLLLWCFNCVVVVVVIAVVVIVPAIVVRFVSLSPLRFPRRLTEYGGERVGGPGGRKGGDRPLACSTTAYYEYTMVGIPIIWQESFLVRCYKGASSLSGLLRFPASPPTVDLPRCRCDAVALPWPSVAGTCPNSTPRWHRPWCSTCSASALCTSVSSTPGE